MKICMILMTEFTHDARVTKEAITLTKAGHKVVFFALKSRETLSHEKRHNFEIYRVTLFTRYFLPKGQLFYFIKYLEFILQLVKEIWNKDFDVYHSHDLETLPIGFILSRIRKKPLIYDSHELYIEMVKHHSIARKIWYFIEKRLASRTSVNIQTTESRAREFSKRYNVPMPLVIMNTQHYQNPVKEDLFRKKYGIRDVEKIILYQGNVHPSRGVDVLVKAIDYLDDVVLILMGAGDYKSVLTRKIDKQNKKILLLDPVPWEDLPSYTASADIGVSLVQNIGLNNYYMLSNKFFEYLTAGLPVVFPDFPEWRKHIIENNIGFVVDETNPMEAAKAIRKILSDHELYEEMSRNARRVVREKYNWEIEGGKLLKAYEEIEARAIKLRGLSSN
ncbi:glycosyltransferase [candidate division KSB1 bacterium]|nr:glycosyltransferase [candidate division KSB1 bacterium]